MIPFPVPVGLARPPRRFGLDVFEDTIRTAGSSMPLFAVPTFPDVFMSHKSHLVGCSSKLRADTKKNPN